MAAVLALAIEVRRLVELVIARRLGGGRHAGVERRGAEDAGGDERAHQAFGENTHYKSFPGSAIPSLVEIGCFGEKTSRLPIALHEPKATSRNARIPTPTKRPLHNPPQAASPTPIPP